MTAAQVAAGSVRFEGIVADRGAWYWVESRPAEDGRRVVCRADAGDRIADCTPADMSVRTRVHEYGGGAFAVANGVIVFSNFADQRLYRLDPGGVPVPITPIARRWFADLQIDAYRASVLAVCEDHGVGGREPVNTIVRIPLRGGDPATIVAGSDFYSSPHISPDGHLLAWLSWNHPQMPWDGTNLWVAQVHSNGTLKRLVHVAGSPRESVLQPEWSPDGVLHFLSDLTGWWNLYRWRAERVEAIHPCAADYGEAPCGFGGSTYTFLDARRVACVAVDRGTARLELMDIASGATTAIPVPWTDASFVRATGGVIACVASSPTEPAAIQSFDLATGATRTLRSAGSAPDGRALALPETIAFPTIGGATAYGFYYPPSHHGSGSRPPLLVQAHGGPTSRASCAFDWATQYWTSRGFAMLMVNYRGSTGYGRAYRDALRGQWGIADVDDCVAGAQALIARGLVDPDRIAIRGGSAGGFTALAALAFRDFFHAGVSLYGISDLETISTDTEKFESRYLDGLVPADQRRARSPVHAADRITAPVLLLQGGDDQAVPPSQSEKIVAVLRARGVSVEYHVFPGEGHGFRRAETIIRALELEEAFYERALPPRVL